ncbi:MAG: transcriptional repressor [Gammaproteobacteria bacterium]|nr:MAG: transcriptional repressor [Gammaproteobacteria bacterium]
MRTTERLIDNIDLEQAMAKAVDLCKSKNIRLTKTRKRVLEIIWQNQGILKAYDILEILEKEDKSAKPITVYRALDFLIENGLAYKVESINSFFSCPKIDQTCEFQLLICDKCGKVEAVPTPEACRSLDQYANELGFKVTSKVIEAHGACKECQNCTVGK